MIGSFSWPLKGLKAGKLWSAVCSRREKSHKADRISQWRKAFIGGEEPWTQQGTEKNPLQSGYVWVGTTAVPNSVSL